MKCPDCGDNMKLNDITNTYNCIGCGKVIKKGKEVGEAIETKKANNVLSRKLAPAIAGATIVSFVGLAVLFTREIGNNNSINNKPNTNGTHTEAESDYSINNDDLSENIVLKEIDEGDVIVTVALPEGYEPIKIDGKYYGEKRTTVTKPAIKKIIYGLTKEGLEKYNIIDNKGVSKTNPEDTIDLIESTGACPETIYGLTKEELEKYNVIDQKGVSKTNPEDTISLRANSQYCAESGWTLSGSYQRKTIISQVPATVVNTTTINNTYRKK